MQHELAQNWQWIAQRKLDLLQVQVRCKWVPCGMDCFWITLYFLDGVCQGTTKTHYSINRYQQYLFCKQDSFHHMKIVLYGIGDIPSHEYHSHGHHSITWIWFGSENCARKCSFTLDLPVDMEDNRLRPELRMGQSSWIHTVHHSPTPQWRQELCFFL